jgi:hypothetical protein
LSTFCATACSPLDNVLLSQYNKRYHMQPMVAYMDSPMEE